MGTTARLIVVGGSPDLADDAVLRIADLEARWSRFLPSSELSRVNAAAGSPCIVSTDTFELIHRLVDGWWATAGRFDPTVHDAMLRIGYSRSWPFAHGDSAHGVLDELDDMPSPGCADIVLDRRSRMVWLPHGVHLDPGGLGKGFAADLIAEELIEDGAEGALVDLGGDIRVIGMSPTGGSWCIAVEHPTRHDETIAIVETTGGGIATTSRGKRRWNTDAPTPVHHVVDPATGRPATQRWTSATVLAPTAAAAEIGAKVAFIDGTTDSAPNVPAALLADADGQLEVVGANPELFLAAGAR